MVGLNLKSENLSPHLLAQLRPLPPSIVYFCGFSPMGPSAPGPIAVRAKKGKTGGFPVRETTRSLSLKLPPDTEPLNDALVTRFITHLDIVKQFAALADQLEQTTA